MPKTVQVSLGYEARPQFVPFHQRLKRWACIVAHRRAGKTLACVADLVDAALRTKKEAARFAYVAPTFGQAKDIAWSYLKRLTAPIPGVETREVDLATVLPNGARIRLYGADAYDRMRGIYLDGVVLDEVADFDPRAWPEVIRPALADRQGWGVFIGTPKGRNAFWEVYSAAQTDADWFTMMLRASESGLLPDDELHGMRKLLSPEAYAQEMECSFDAAVVGSYYGKLLDEALSEGRIGTVPVERGSAVHTAWDLGIGDSTAIWFFQTIGREVRVVDYHEASGEALDHYAKVLQARGYVYGEHYLPHDAEARELGTGTTRLETLGKLGVRGRVVPAQAKDDSINAVRMLIPRCWFDAERCKVGLEALRLYRRDFDDRLKTFRDRPRHDWCFTGEVTVLTRYGTRAIKDLPLTGEVLTPCGWKQYHAPRVTRKNASLVEVRFGGGHTVRCTPDHLFLTESGWKSAEHLTPGSLIRSSLTRTRSISMAAFTAFGRVTDISRAAVSVFTGMFGNWHSAQFLPVATSTTATAIGQTTNFQISNACPQKSIFPKHGKITSAAAQSIFPSTLAKRLRLGISRKKDAFGTADTLSEQRAGLSGSGKKSLARNVASSFRRWFANRVIRNSTAPRFAGSLVIESVAPLSEKEDVWCMTIPDGEWFSLANGAVVHNCSHAADAFAQFAIGHREHAAPDMAAVRARLRQGRSSGWMAA